MAKIYCIVGKSCTGKDTLLKKMLEERKDLTPIVTYTTRPQRPNEKNAKDYYFVDKSNFEKLKYQKKIIESRVYNTAQGDWIYFTVNDGQIDINSNKKYILINTLVGARKLKDIYGETVVNVIHIVVSDDSRIMRALGREINGNHNFVEMCRRFLADTKDYDASNFRKLNLRENIVENENFITCLEEVNKLIK